MRFLIHTGPGIGDIIQFLSMARAIKEQYSDSVVDFLMRGSEQTLNLNNQILECQDYADTLYWYSSKAIKHDAELIISLYRKHYDFGIVRIGNVNGDISQWIYKIMRIARCKTIIGYGTDKVDIKVDIPERAHYLTRNEMLLQAAGINARKNAISINKKKLDINWLKTLKIPPKAKVIGLSLGTNSMSWNENGNTIAYDVKSWAMEKWIKLTKILVQDGFCVLLIGGKKEQQEISNLGIVIPGNKQIIDLVGKTSIKQSLTAISRCTLMVGSEGGMMHCASALGIKTLTIFGGSDYKMWNPGGTDSPIVNLDLDCSPCFCTSRGANCRDHKCLESISIDVVHKQVIKLCEEL